MSAKEMLQTLGTSLAPTASVKSVFGDPIRAEGKTIVPVARVAYGFGAGFGRGEGTHQAAPTQHGEGGGGGGGLRAVPAGVLEITDRHTRFVRFHRIRPLAAAFVTGAVLGALLSRRKKSRGSI